MGDSRGAAVRPATAAGCLRPWMPTGSTKVEPLQSFGRLGMSRMNPPKIHGFRGFLMMKSYGGWRSCTSRWKVYPS